MLTKIRAFFSPPIFEDDEEKNLRTQAVFTVALVIFGIFVLGAVLVLLFIGVTQQLIMITVGLIGTVIAFFLVKQRKISAASYLLIITLIVVVYTNTLLSGGMRRPGFYVNIPILAVAMLIFRKRGLIITGAVLIILNIIVYGIEMALPKFINFEPVPLSTIAVANSFVIIATVMILQYANSTANKALRRAHESETALKASNQELQAISFDLEKRVKDRTSLLEEATKRTDKRASQLKAVTEVAKAIASIRDIDLLLPSITRLISQQFNFYHVGIFLLDERGNESILRAANSEGGRKMLERGHRLRVGRQGIVGYAAAEAKPGIALDTGENAIFFNNPDLPLTRSEIALPLIAGQNVIGVLDVQSDEPSAFSEDDVEVLLTLAYQVAIAIQNADLFSQTTHALEEFQSIQHQLTGKQWEQYLATQKIPAFKFTGTGVVITETADTAETSKAIESGKIVQTENEVAVPIILRGRSIGVLNLKSTEQTRNWDNDEMKMAQAAAERVAVALENARLIDETQKRAARERAIAEMSARIAASIDIDTILKSTAQELGRLIQDSEITVRLGETANIRSVE